MTRPTRAAPRRGGVSFLLVALITGASILASPWVLDRAEELATWGWRQPGSSATVPPLGPAGGSADTVGVLDTVTVVPERPDVAGYQRGGCGEGEACSCGPAWTDDSAAPNGHNGCGTRVIWIFCAPKG